MRKFYAFIMVILLLATLSACGEAASKTENSEPTTKVEGFAYTFSDVKLFVGDVFNPEALPEAESVYQVPSCAIEGTDNVYNYGTFELTAFNDGEKETIYSIYFVDANTPTDEGLYLGDSIAQMESIYGTEYQQNGSEIVYTKGNSKLIFIVQSDFIISIEFRMAT